MSDVALVSVIICAFNAERTLRSAIESAARQTWTSLEIIVVDDGSQDRTESVVLDLLSKEPRLRLHTQRNGGVAHARNTGLHLAHGSIIAFLDSDDLWAADHLAEHVKALSQDGAIGVSFSNVVFVDSDASPTGDVSRTPAGEVSARDVLAGNPCTTCSTMVIRKSCFESVGSFRSDLHHAEDQQWLLRACLGGWRLVCDGRRSVFYRTSPSGLSSDLEGMYRGFRSVLETAAQSDPELVAREGALSHARLLRYLARRALRLGLGRATAGRYLTRALLTSPRILLVEPKAFAGTVFGLIAPGVFRTRSSSTIGR